ncbi:CBS domain protein [Polystyrenella longa]|uniref:CBS domain protein n=1 Tax=Polystyrenella longa TaxID=2528007 RepID=A0A518CJ59_9PLAN|nr:CBS domain-containing protein [Polystyrenella longa]QDU79265.1 CBS domain protein [Polystyrenella longa]
MRITAGDLMNSDVERLQENQCLMDAARLFLSEELSQIYIISEEQEFLGLLTDYALIKARLSGLGWDEQIARLISRSVTTIAATADISTVIPLFREGHGNVVPVLHEGFLVGELKRNAVLQIMLALDPSCTLTSLQELEDESNLEKQCESDMKQDQFKSEQTLSMPMAGEQPRPTLEKVIPAPHLQSRPQGMISSLNAPEDLFRDRP